MGSKQKFNMVKIWHIECSVRNLHRECIVDIDNQERPNNYHLIRK